MPPESEGAEPAHTHGARSATPVKRPNLIQGVRIKPALPTLYVTVNVADGVNVWFRFLSTTLIFNVYVPGARSFKGSSFSTVTCDAPPGSPATSSLNSNTFSFDPAF